MENRYVSIMISDIQNNIKIVEEKLELNINSETEDIEMKMMKTKNLLRELVTLESMIIKWVELTTIQPDKEEK